MTEPADIRARLSRQAAAYAAIKRGTDELLRHGHIHRNERLLLRLARWLATTRLRQHIVAMHPDDAEALLRDL